MRCERVRSLYEEYTRETLALASLNRVEEHLVACPSCREFYEQNDAIAHLVRRSSEIAHPGPQYFEDLAASVLARLDAPAAGRRDPARILSVPSNPWRRPLWWSGAMAAAALVALGLMPRAGDSDSGRQVASLTPPAPLVLDAAASPGGALSGPAERLIQRLDSPQLAKADFNKGISGQQTGDAAIERLMATGDMLAELGRAPEGGQRPFGPPPLGQGETKPGRDGAMTLASQSPPPPKTIPTEIFETLQAIKTEALAGRVDKDLRAKMRRLEEMIAERSFYQTELNAMPDFRQVKLYLEAEEALAAGQLDEAFKKFRGILFVDELSPLATRASLPLADLFYDGSPKWVNFREAENYYHRCRRDRGGIFSAMELDHIAKQLSRLERYKAGGWQALSLLHTVRHGGWPETLAAMKGLAGLAEAGALLPEAARVMLDRMETGKAPVEITLDLYNLLAKRAAEEQNVDIRAWLELALGDLASTQFQDLAQAKDRYRRALAVSAASGAAKQARLNLNALEESGLVEALRKRK